MSAQPDELWLLPVGMKHQLGEAIKLNQRILQYLNKFPGPVGVDAHTASSIRHHLDDLRELNHQIDKMCAGWLDCGEG